MVKLSVPDLYGLVQRHGAYAPVDRCVVAGILEESGGETVAHGDYDPTYTGSDPAVGHWRSWGLFQMEDGGAGTGMTVAARCDPDTAAAIMVPLYVRYWESAPAGLDPESQAARAYIFTEKPLGYPNYTDSAAAIAYRQHWRELEDTMPDDTATATYDPSTERVAQTDDWSCSVAAATWALRSLAVDIDYRDLEQRELDAGLVSTAAGLRDATGGPLADWLAAEFGLAAAYDAGVRWDWLVAHAGQFPILLGGRRWGVAGHWVAVRDVDEDGMLALANPAEGYGGVFETLTERQFQNVGPCSAVWLGREEDMARIADLVQQVAASDSLVGVLRDAGRVARENIEQALAVEGLPAAAQDALANGALPAAQTIERGATQVEA